MNATPENSPSWGSFTRALLDTLEAHMQPEERAVLLRAIGTQIAALSPIPPEDTLSGLEAQMNERLAVPGWGAVSIALDSSGPALILTHDGLPVLPTGSDAAGAWIMPVLEGLHGGWIAAQPGAEPQVQPQVVSSAEGTATLRYGA